jgi:hypothetical protein
MRTLLIIAILTAGTSSALAGRALTQEETVRLVAAVIAQTCGGGKMEFDDGKFKVDDATCLDGKTYDLEFDSSYRVISKKLDESKK